MSAGRPGTGRLLLVAAALGAVAVALPWRNSSVQLGIGTTFVPGYCGVGTDGYSYCDPGQILTGTTATLGGPVAGAAGPIRVIGVLAALLLLTAWRAGARKLAVGGIGVAAAGLFVDGITVTSGHLVWLAALLLTVVAFQRRGLVPPSGLRRPAYRHR